MNERTDYPYKDDNVVHNWVTAGGRNDAETVTNFLKGRKTADLAADIHESWKFTPALTLEKLRQMVDKYRTDRSAGRA